MSNPDDKHLNKRDLLLGLAGLGVALASEAEAAKKKAKAKAKSKTAAKSSSKSKKTKGKAAPKKKAAARPRAPVEPPKPTGQLKSDFVSVEGRHFKLHEETYRFVGANMWYGAYLGADAVFGNRARLIKELDDLKALGVTNLRVLASSELSPLNNSLDPAFRTKDAYNETLLEGLDFLMAEMDRRDMKAVLYLTNFWEWSGGMMTYLYWTNGGSFINNGDPAHPWPEFADFVAQFYKSPEALALYADYVRLIVSRTNCITGKPYLDDPTLMAWQLCNEPRPAGAEAKVAAGMPAYRKWIADTAALIRSLDQNHLVSLGSEGLIGVNMQTENVIQAHEHIDYMTAHIWPQNWSWVDANNLAGTFGGGAEKVKDYIRKHVEIANFANKPLVFEEFGFPRDGGLFDPGTPTTFKDQFYRMIYDTVEESIRNGMPVAGSNFWAWSGAGRALHEDHKMLRGETAYVGDPPHEPQGWYGVFNSDVSTQVLIKAHAQRLSIMSKTM